MDATRIPFPGQSAAAARRRHPVQAALLMAILLLCTAHQHAVGQAQSPAARPAGVMPWLGMGVVVPCLG